MAEDKTLFDSEEECEQHEDMQEIIKAINGELCMENMKIWHYSTERLAKNCPFALKKYIEYLIKENENANI